MEYVLLALGILWSSPVAILAWVFYILPVWALGWIRLSKRTGLIFEFVVTERNNWYGRAWSDWWGQALPHALIISYDAPRGGYHYIRTVTHEERHCYQWFLFGPLFPILYALASIGIWVFYPNKHAYLDNPFERDARKAAGQKVDIPREEWTNGTDRWPWW
jgi:hypothetical protein